MKTTNVLLAAVLLALIVLIVQQAFLLEALDPRNYRTYWNVAKGSELLTLGTKWSDGNFEIVAPVKDMTEQDYVVQQRWRK